MLQHESPYRLKGRKEKSAGFSIVWGHFICPNQVRKLLDEVLKILRHPTADWEAFKTGESRRLAAKFWLCTNWREQKEVGFCLPTLHFVHWSSSWPAPSWCCLHPRLYWGSVQQHTWSQETILTTLPLRCAFETAAHQCCNLLLRHKQGVNMVMFKDARLCAHQTQKMVFERGVRGFVCA